MVTVRSLLLLVLIFLRPNEVSTLDLWISRGKLSIVKSSLGALTQLSRDLQQSTTWWQLTNVSWHPEALWRFMVLGPPPVGTLPSESWNPKVEDAVLLKRKAFAATRETAVAEYETQVRRPGTGIIKVAAWALMYNCLTQDCDIVAPVVLAQPSSSASEKHNYATLWQQLYAEGNASGYVNPILVSASTADIKDRSVLVAPGDVTSTFTSKNTRLMLRMVTENVGQCETSLAFGRTPLGAAYKVMPGLCYHNHPTLVQKLNQSYMFAALEDQKHNYSWPFPRADLENCKNAPVLIKKLETFKVCVFCPDPSVYICANYSVSDYGGTNCSGNDLPNKMKITISTLMLVYRYARNQSSLENLTEDYTVVNYTVPGAPCDTTGVARLAKYNASSRHVFSLSHSIWEDTEGSATDEFSYGRASGKFCHYGIKFEDEDNGAYLRRCYVSTMLNTTISRCDATAVDSDLLNVMFNDSVTAYADEHNTAFNIDKGPATDLFTAWAALVTAAVSVLTATIPCTNLELEYLARFAFPKTHERLKLLKFSIVALLNVVFGMILYAPIFAMIVNESYRSETYYTWTILTNDVKVNTFGTQMRTVLIVEGESLYVSRILSIFIVVCAITFPLIVLLTLKRSNKVFCRRKLLLRERYPPDGVPPYMNHHDANEINVKAIEMGLSEYVRLKSTLEKRTELTETDRAEGTLS